MNKCTLGDDFDVKEFVEITDGASQRTRWITIILVIATVIIFIGFYNSTEISWARHRLLTTYNSEYIPNVNTSHEEPYPILDSFFGSKDFQNEKGFVCRILDEAYDSKISADTQKLSFYLYSNFNHKTQNLLNRECRPEERPADLTDQLENLTYLDLNRILNDQFLFSEEKFQNVVLRTETDNYKKLLNRLREENLKMSKNDLIVTNRMLLEDAYPDYIYRSQNIVPVDGDDGGNIVGPDDKRKMDRQYETVRAYIDNIQYIKIPFFGIAIDINDLGAIGGFSLIIILMLLRFSLSREIKNLNISFKESFLHGKLCPYYHNLAMRQVFTVPRMEGEKKNDLLVIASKMVYLLPVVFMTLGVVYDYISTFYLRIFEVNFVLLTLTIETVFLLIIFYLSVRCLERQIHIDDIWEDYWKIMQTKKSSDILMDDNFKKSDDEEIIRIVDFRLHRNSYETGSWISNLIRRTPEFLKFTKKIFQGSGTD